MLVGAGADPGVCGPELDGVIIAGRRQDQLHNDNRALSKAIYAKELAKKLKNVRVSGMKTVTTFLKGNKKCLFRI
jgi:hypothetical protein